TKDENSFLFENYPWPFVKDGKLNKVTVVVPDDIASADLNLLSNIFAYMGRSINDNTGNLRVVRDSSFSGKYGDTNIIFIGTPSELKSLKSINSSMYFKYDDSFSYFLSNEMRNLMEDFSRTLSSMQLITSPYNKSCGILVVTAPRKENVVNTEKYLTQSKYAGSLIGNAALVDQWGDITNHYFILKTDSKASLLQKIENGGQNLEVFVVSFITIIILLIISIGLYFRKYKRR
ncbi:MAG: cellulose biosynthesis cyclic di-GMP-binding regulatory protein BcsB, partial [Bacillota bacterium]|nr:cellulose biosynthesis cyclic di-GMP-binding regulatory protein BcsB [Bacillota bacterium]